MRAGNSGCNSHRIHKGSQPVAGTREVRAIATSRTGTGKWRRLRTQAITSALDAGQYTCPHCRTHLDYDTPGRPNSAEVDHVIPHSRGGQDTIDNVMVICRLCNQTKGGGRRKARVVPRVMEPSTVVRW